MARCREDGLIASVAISPSDVGKTSDGDVGQCLLGNCACRVVYLCLLDVKGQTVVDGKRYIKGNLENVYRVLGKHFETRVILTVLDGRIP